MTQTPIAGYQMRLYRSPVGSDVWTLVGAVQSVSIENVSREMIEVAYRGDAWKRNFPGLMEAMEATVKMLHNVEPASEALIRNDFIQGTPAMYAAVNGDIAAPGTEGWTFPAYVVQYNRSEELTEIVTNDIKLTLGHVMVDGKLINPEWLIVTTDSDGEEEGEGGET